jgi:inositol transport system substrate-binding protein
MTRSHKFSISLPLLLILSALLAACGATAPTGSDTTGASRATSVAAAGGEQLTIGVSIAQFDTFLSLMADGMQKEADSQGVELIQVNAKEDTATQLSQVENFIAQKVDAIVVNAVDTSAVDPITRAAQDAKIPLIYVNRLPANLPQDDPKVVFVGSNSIVAGTYQGEWLANKLGGKGNVVIMMGKLDNEAAINRTEGVEQVFAKYPDIKITKKDTANWSRDEGLTLMENWLATGEQIDAVAANNDEMALGALQALEEAGKADQVLVGGVDATPDALASMESGKLDVTVFQDAAGQGAGSIRAAIGLAKGEQVEKFVDIPYQQVTLENYTQFKN